MPDSAISIRSDSVGCPFCGLACDDIGIAAGAAVEVTANGCARSRAAFARSADAAAATTPRVAGRPVTPAAAAQEIAHLLAAAELPLIAGLATDVAGMRAALALADRVGMVVDHMDSPARLRNLAVVQSGGWITTTLSEVRNRADLLLVVGGDIVGRFPRFFERCVWNKESLFTAQRPARDVIYLGNADNTTAGVAPDGRPPQTIACANEQLHEVFAALLALLHGRPLAAEHPGGVARATLERLLERMRGATYGVAAWSTADFDFPHAELTIAALAELIGALNRDTRFAGLPLGGSDGGNTASQVTLWHTGFPLRTSLASGRPVYDPLHFDTQRLLASGEADALLWISSFDPLRTPPPCAGNVRTMVLGHAAMKPAVEPDVFIPVGTPGVDHAGHFVRSDDTVIVPLTQLRDSGLPSVAQTLGAVLQTLENVSC
jgi:formylmethanofuran dehydrogenase subunit B